MVGGEGNISGSVYIFFFYNELEGLSRPTVFVTFQKTICQSCSLHVQVRKEPGFEFISLYTTMNKCLNV